MKPKVSILIVHKDGENILNNCLKSIYQKTKYSNFEVVLLLNGTEDDSKKIVDKYDVKLYQSKKNLGFSKGVNFLINKTTGEYIILLNNDTEVKENWLKELVNYAEKNNVAACQPKVLSLKNKRLFEHAGAVGGCIDKYGYPFYRGEILSQSEIDKGQYNYPMRIFWACGSCIMIKRKILNNIGLLDEEFFMYSEDMDWCWRINLSGEEIYSVPTSVIYHLGSYTIKKKKMDRKKEYLLHRNVLLTFFKNYDKKTIKKLIIPRILLEIVSGIAFPKKIIPICKSFYWLFKNREVVRQKHKETQKLRKISDDEIQKLMLKESIAWLFFIRGKKTFNEIKEYF